MCRLSGEAWLPDRLMGCYDLTWVSPSHLYVGPGFRQSLGVTCPDASGFLPLSGLLAQIPARLPWTTLLRFPCSLQISIFIINITSHTIGDLENRKSFHASLCHMNTHWKERQQILISWHLTGAVLLGGKPVLSSFLS